uniref:Sister chromatid cohesion protein DCC1 n=1 Tax=Salvator merianae TaxID=96440 RepID=A0A8D0BAF3_SALMN
MAACYIKGHWRILDFDYEMNLLNHVTQLIYTESWSLDRVPLSTCLQELGYGKKYICEDETYFETDEEKILWQQSVPEGIVTRLDQLKGLALVDQSSRPETIFLLNVEDLPKDNQRRFNSLFTITEKWTEAEITPYIQDVCSEKQIVGALLTKYCRSSMQNGLKVCNSRRLTSVRSNSDLELKIIYRQ